MNTFGTRRKKWIRWSAGAMMALVVALAGLAYLYDMPGGIADWQYSRASKLSYTIQIPIGRTPEEAVRKFRGDDDRFFFHREAVDEGMLLFYRNPSTSDDRAVLQIEYVRRTWLGGWKWAMGGGYGQPVDPDEALNFMAIPRYAGVRGPFPILFGNVSSAEVESIFVKAGGKDAGGTRARIAAYAPDRRIWFAVLPPSAAVPYEIEALNRDGVVIAAMSTDDVHYSGRLLKNH